MKTLHQRMERFQLRIVRRSLRMHDGCITRTAAALGISRPTLYGYMHRFGLCRSATNTPPSTPTLEGRGAALTDEVAAGGVL